MWAVVHAGRGQYAAAAYAPSADGGLMCVVAETIVSPQELCEMMANDDGGCALTGEFDDALEGLARERMGQRLTIAPDALRVRSAANAARLGLLRLSRGDADDVAALEPLYLRPPAAVERAEARARSGQ